MIKARIYIPSKSAMQSGRAHKDHWVLEFENPQARTPDPLMGWTQSKDTLAQVRLKFDDLDSAKRYAEEKGLDYIVSEPHKRKIKPRNYGDNFKYVKPPSPAPAEEKKAEEKSKGVPKTNKKTDTKKAAPAKKAAK